MKQIVKIPALLLAVLLTAGLSGCGAAPSSSSSSSQISSSAEMSAPPSSQMSSSSEMTSTSSTPMVDTVASASRVYYEQSSLSKEELLASIQKEEGVCTIATVNADGTPNLIVASAGVAGEDHIAFGLAPSVTKSNFDRTGQGVICYYIHNPQGTDKFERNHGARLVVEVETDPAVLATLGGSDVPTYLRIVEVLPLG